MNMARQILAIKADELDMRRRTYFCPGSCMDTGAQCKGHVHVRLDDIVSFLESRREVIAANRLRAIFAQPTKENAA
jgi:hypothetical protein